METKQEFISSIIVLVTRLTTRLADEDVDERAHMYRRCSASAQQALDIMSVQMLHLLDVIPARDEQPDSINVVGISEVVGTPKGTVSKRIKRLADAGAVSRFRLAGNRKEVHLQLSSVGEEIRAAHRSLHTQMGDGFGDFLDRYPAEDLEVVYRMIGDLVRMPREGLRFRPDLLD